MFIAVDDIVGAAAGVRIEAHVQGAIAAKAESLLGFIQLVGGYAQVEEDAVHFAESLAVGYPLHLAEVSLYEHHPVGEGREPFLCPDNRFGVGVQAQEPSMRGAGSKQAGGMVAAAKRSVDESTSGLGLHGFEHFL